MNSRIQRQELGDLEDALEKESSWRKKELFQCLTHVDATGGSAQRLVLRSSTAILYAHWEGWVKSISRLYLSFVNSQRLNTSELSACLQGAALKSKFTEIQSSNTARSHTDFANFLNSGQLETPQEINLDLISAGSNLSSNVFNDILIRLGVDPQSYKLQYNLIEDLRNTRNRIAHGEYAPINPDRYRILHDQILQICTSLDADIKRLALERRYLKNKFDSLIEYRWVLAIPATP